MLWSICSLSAANGHMSNIGMMVFDSKTSPLPETVYGREYTIKCLSRANLDEEASAARTSEMCASDLFKEALLIILFLRLQFTSE